MGNGKGFSLIEVMLALAILILGLIGIILVFPVGLRASREASILSEGTLVAQSHLEEIKTLGYEKIDVTEGTQKGFKWQISFEPVTPEGVKDPSGLRKAIVTIQTTLRGKERKEAFVTLVNR